ncbi:CD63 antigen [Neodiprion pinetum]|uniref:Tetraspanin n=1 Tax=Neodiprion lecontei TaxID=441921 RepID=A0A6J0B9I4_NEOLC|nr:CD63 antigen [Neodiprion lecontei]XP_046425782.1 CD63 antigen-like [Neodiprion fabricii]XP_046482204.1 CD63 antigen [Neodiprion pinetum]XP_046619866.1 CD63 antigen-like [Neodiprion virginianus]
MESCGMSLIKYILFFFNLIFAVSGIGIIVAGALVLSDVGEFSHFLEGRITAPPVVLIVAGAIVFFIAFLGCYGAIKENYTLLIAFAGALVVIFAIELAVGIAAAVFRNDFSMAMKETLRSTMTNYTEADKMAWNNVQQKLQCCGIDGPEDWERANVLPSGTLPESCCNLDSGPSTQCIMNSQSKVYRRGCYMELESRVQNGAKILIGVGIGIAFIEIAGVVLACFLANAIKREGGEK